MSLIRRSRGDVRVAERGARQSGSHQAVAPPAGWALIENVGPATPMRISTLTRARESCGSDRAQNSYDNIIARVSRLREQGLVVEMTVVLERELVRIAGDRVWTTRMVQLVNDVLAKIERVFRDDRVVAVRAFPGVMVRDQDCIWAETRVDDPAHSWMVVELEAQGNVPTIRTLVDDPNDAVGVQTHVIDEASTLTEHVHGIPLFLRRPVALMFPPAPANVTPAPVCEVSVASRGGCSVCIEMCPPYPENEHRYCPNKWVCCCNQVVTRVW